MFDAIFPKHWTTLQRLMWLKTNALARAVYETITGNPVSFTARNAPLRQLQVAFSPVQDLHGYDSPWPAGGGANIMPTIPAGTYTSGNITAVVSNNGLITVTGSKEAGADNTITFPALESAFALPLDSYVHLRNSAAVTGVTLGIGGSAPSINPANRIFQNTIERTPSVVVNLYFRSDVEGTFNFTLQPSVELTGSVTDWTPYENLCPISGWSSLTVEQRGKNLFDKDSAQIADGWWSVTDCTVGEPLPNYAASGNYHTSAPIPVVAGQTYSVVGCGGLNGSFLYLDKDMNYLDGFANASYSSRTFTVPNNLSIAYLRFPFSTATVDTCQLELGTTASTFTPYNPSSRSISISLGQTVYSGYVDVVTGVGEIDYKLINARDVLWPSSGNVVYTHPNDLYTKITEETPTGRKPLYCNAIKYSANASLAGGGIGYGGINNNGNITVLMTSPWATPEEWIAYITNNDVFICYPLAEPIPIQLTPQEVESLAGDNNLWSDANQPITVEYRKN